jgi:plastocyanin
MPFFHPALLPARVGALGIALAIFFLTPGVSALAEAQNSVPVDMKNFVYAPAEIRIAPGQSVTWTNRDFVAHTITADDRTFDSGYIALGGTFTQQFDTPGTYQYFCQPHGAPGLVGMAATVVVDG